jgi:hypothetical protein
LNKVRWYRRMRDKHMSIEHRGVTGFTTPGFDPA